MNEEEDNEIPTLFTTEILVSEMALLTVTCEHSKGDIDRLMLVNRERRAAFQASRDEMMSLHN